MKEERNKINRRNFLKTVGAAGLGSVFTSCKTKADTNEPNAPEEEQKYPQVPKRKLGKTGVEVPCLSLGMMYNVIENQIILRNSLRWGVNYWDTAPAYAGENSERGIGKFLSKNAEVRKDVFLVTKASGAKTAADVERCLQASLKRMNTDYIDLYCAVHALDDPSQLTDELGQWAGDAKSRKLIRFVGFTTHSNMAENLTAAAKLGWVDAIMTTYNFRVMQDEKMLNAIDACHKAGVGLIAMKTTGKTIVGWARQEVETEEDKKFSENFLKQGFTQEQANIKVVLADERISSVCVGMENVAILTSNAAAALDKTEFMQADMQAFRKYAQATCSGYCAGCARICDSALPDTPYVSNIMRYLMYYNSYGDRDRARKLFAQIPGSVRSKLLNIDYSTAEARCPQHIPIGKFIAEAVGKLA